MTVVLPGIDQLSTQSNGQGEFFLTIGLGFATMADADAVRGLGASAADVLESGVVAARPVCVLARFMRLISGPSLMSNAWPSEYPMHPRFTRRWLKPGATRALLCLLMIACNESTAPDLPPPAPLTVTVAGTVESGDAVPLSGVTVSVRLEQGPETWRYSEVGTAVTGVDGTYTIELELDSLPAEGDPELRTDAATEPGTGFRALQFHRQEVTVSGTGETLTNDIVLVRAADPAPPPPFPALQAADLLAGMYDGEPIPPYSNGFTTWLTFRVDSAPGLVYGRWYMAYNATTVGGDGTFAGSMSGDTLHLVLADTSNGFPGGNCGGTFELDLVAEAVDADTLIAWLSRGTATGCHVEEAPFRVARVPVSPRFN